MSRKKSFFDKRVVVCGVFSALSVLILYLGALIEVLDLSVSAMASLVIVLIVIEMGHSYAWLTYLAVSILSLILLPPKACRDLFCRIYGILPDAQILYRKNKIARRRVGAQALRCKRGAVWSVPYNQVFYSRGNGYRAYDVGALCLGARRIRGL